MSTTAAVPAVPAARTAPQLPVPRRAARPAYRVTGLRVLRAEWAKFRSLRSTWVGLGVALAVLTALGLVAAAVHAPTNAAYSGGTSRDAVSFALSGVDFAQLGVGVLGVLLTAGEYATGTIRATLSAVPKRLPVLWSKVAVVGGATLAVAAAAVLGTFLGGAVLLHGTGLGLGLTAPGVARSLAGAVLYLAMVGVLGAALGALLRSVAGAIAVLVVGLMLLRVILGVLPSAVQDAVGPFLPGNAGTSMYTLHQTAHSLGPVAGFAVLGAWTALVLGAAAVRMVRKDV